MKKLVMTAAVLTCTAYIVSAQTVTSANIVGYYKIPKPAAGLEIASIQMQDGDLNTLLDKSQFVGYWDESSADHIIAWNSGSQAYVIYALYDGTEIEDPTIEWRDIGDFYTAGNPIPVKAGDGMWVQSQGSSAQPTSLIAGEVVLDHYATNSIVAGLNLLSFPFSSAIDLNAAGLKESGATGYWDESSADHVIAWDVGAQSYVIFALFDGTEISDPTVEWRDIGDFYSAAPPISVDLGKGFWYQAQSGFVWVAENPYFGNL